MMLDSIQSQFIDYEPVVVDRQTSLSAAIAALRQTDFTAIWVTETDPTGHRHLLGAVFPAQLLHAIAANPSENCVESVMCHLPLLSLNEPLSIESCLEYFIQHQVDFLPIAHPDQTFAGVISKWALLAHYQKVDSINHLAQVFEHSLDGLMIMMCDQPVEWHDAIDKTTVVKEIFARQRTIYVNDAFLKQSGSHRPNVMGQTLTELVSQELPSEILKWQRFFDTGNMRATVQERQRDDGHSAWLEANYTCLYDQQRRIVGHFCIRRDVSYYRKIEARLRQQERYLSIIVAIQQQLLASNHRFLTDDLNQQEPSQVLGSQLSLSAALQPLKTTYQEILRQLGQTAHASRVYLFENDADGYCMSQQLEWCAEGIQPEIDNPVLQNLPYAEFSPRWRQVLAQGETINDVVSDLPESERVILAQQGILTILVLPLLVEGKFWGFIGFDNCETVVPWNNSEVTLLAATAAAISMHLENCQVAYLRHRTLHRERLTHQLINQMRQSLRIEDVLATTPHQLRHLLRCDRTVIYRFNSDWSGSFVAESVSSDWTPFAQSHPDSPHLDGMMASYNACQIQDWRLSGPFEVDTYLQDSQGGAYRQGKSYSCVNDVFQANFEACYLDLLKQFQARAYLTTPIYVGDRLWGLLANYQNSGPRQWEGDDIDLVLNITTQLGVVLQHIELLEQTRQQSLALAKANAAAETAMQAKNEFLANVSHELRTPLNAILGFSTILSDEMSAAATETTALEQQEYIDIIGRNGRALLTLINNVLEVARLDTGQSQLLSRPFDLHQLLNELQAWLEKKAQPKGVALAFYFSPALPRQIISDRDKLWQVLINLCSNAVKFTQVGYITLRAYVRNQTEIDAKTTRLNLAFEIEDTGQGIAQEELVNLFQPFYKTQSGRQFGQGAGLGLAVSQKFLHLMGSSMTVRSTLGHGSLFKFNLWVMMGRQTVAEAPSPRSTLSAPAPAPTVPPRILVVDTQSQDHYQLKQFLAPLGFDLRTANSASKALKLWSAWHPHLLFIDGSEAIVNGQSIVQHIHQETQKQNSIRSGASYLLTKVIVLVAQDQEPSTHSQAASDFDDVLYEPIQDSDLLAILTKYLNFSPPIPSPSASSLSHAPPPAPATLAQPTHTAIEQQPALWRQQVYQAALTGSDEKLSSLVAELPTEHLDLAQQLNILIDNFQFDQIIALMDEQQVGMDN